jgi:hypothetical protein
MGLAMTAHEQAKRRFPSNGWGFAWLGEPERDTDRRQPGGWIYNLLDYLEATPLRRLGANQEGAEKRASLALLSASPLAAFQCPTRSRGDVAEQTQHVKPVNADWSPQVAKTDYAVNEGDFITDTNEGPKSLEEGDRNKFAWKDVSRATGISFQRSEVRAIDVEDGLTHLYLVGEKHVSARGYTNASDRSHDQSMYSGVDWDIARWTLDTPLRDRVWSAPRLFGSAHSGGCYFVLGDGSVRLISYEIERETHRRLGNRRDGLPVALPESP